MKHKLSEYIELNTNFKTSVNLCLDLKRTAKIRGYIPTKSSLEILNQYLESVVNNKNQATLLVGPYGKGKSQLLLILLTLLSLKKNDENTALIDRLIAKIKTNGEIGEKTASNIEKIRKIQKPYIPVLIQNPGGDLTQAFIYALFEALKAEGLENIIPDTAYDAALSRIDEWKKNYPDTYASFTNLLKERGNSVSRMTKELKKYSGEALSVFSELYPAITAGSVFNPLVTNDVFSLYGSISDKLTSEHGYAGLYIIFDEFSKYIEGLSEKNVGNEMNLLQSICELASDSKNGEVFFTMVAHKSIKEYGKYLPRDLINSFTGIEGRLKEKLFITSTKNNYELIRHAIEKNSEIRTDDSYKAYISSKNVDKYYQLPCFRSSFTYEDFKEIIIEGCYPLNPIAAYLLLNISEKIAQNERTLFTFIANDEAGSLARFIKNHKAGEKAIVDADMIYDYFSGLFKNEVLNTSVHNIWLNAEYALSKCNDESERKLIKTLACFLITGKEELPATRSFLLNACDNDFDEGLLDELKKKELIYMRESSAAYLFKTRAGSSLKKEIRTQRKLKKNTNYSAVFEAVSQLHFIIPRKYNSETKMTRYFRHEYMNIDTFMSINDPEAFFDKEKFCDGLAVSLFMLKDSVTYSAKEIINHYKNLKERKLIIILPEKSFSFQNQIKDYEILQELKNGDFFNETEENEVLKRELPLLEDDLEKVIKSRMDEVYSGDKKCRVYYLDDTLSVKDASFSELEHSVSLCCHQIYNKTPLINNEIINRRVIITSPTKKSRLKIIEAILNGTADESFYNNTSQEATVFRALLINPELAHKTEANSGLYDVITEIENYVSSCSGKKQSLLPLINKLTETPYGMRKAVIPIYLAHVLAAGHEDKVIYFTDYERQMTADIIVNMCEKPGDYYLFISKESAEKEKYIKQLNALFSVNENRNLSENRIKNIVICMQRWFRSLPQLSRNLSDLDICEDIPDDKRKIYRSFKSILQPLDVNPYEMLFTTFPALWESSDFTVIAENISSTKDFFDKYMSKILRLATLKTYEIFNADSENGDLYHILKDWYASQSTASKQEILNGHAGSFMACIEKLNIFNDEEVTKLLIKASTDVYAENLGDGALSTFADELAACKKTVESTSDSQDNDRLKLVYTDQNGNEKIKYYDKPQNDSTNVLKNILEDTLADFDDLSKSERISALVEILDKIITQP